MPLYHSEIAQKIQVGVESAPGTLVSANRRLLSIGIEPDPKFKFNEYTARGSKPTTVVVLGKKYTEAKLSGAPTYDELPLFLSSVLCAPTGTGTWTFTPSPDLPDTITTMTTEFGDETAGLLTGFAQRFGYGVVDSFGMKLDRDKLTVEGNMFGLALESGITLTGGATSLPVVPLVPNTADVYLDTSWSGRLGTKIGTAFQFEWMVGDRFDMVWPIDSSFPSFAGHVEKKPKLTIKCKIAVDAGSYETLLTQALAGTSQFLGLKFTGGVIGGTTYGFSIAFACAINDIGKYGPSNSVYACEVDAVMVTDPTSGHYLEAIVQNAQGSL